MKEKLKISIRKLREEQYAHHNKIDFPEVHQFYKSPYSWLKARFYMELSSIFVHFLLKTNIHPNTITIVYGLSAILGGIFIASGNSMLVITGVVIFFMRGILDWSDGHYARKIGKTSKTGHVLDVYGAILGSVCLGTGLGLFVESRNESMIVYYLAVLYPAFRALLLTNYSQSILLKKILVTDYSGHEIKSSSDILTEQNKKIDIHDSSVFSIAYNLIYKFLDDRARTVDFIGFVIILDIFSNSNFTLLLFILLVIKWSVAYIGSFYVVARGDWVEIKHDAVIKNIMKK